jgi:hypothetical protein
MGVIDISNFLRRFRAWWLRQASHRSNIRELKKKFYRELAKYLALHCDILITILLPTSPNRVLVLSLFDGTIYPTWESIKAQSHEVRMMNNPPPAQFYKYWNLQRTGWIRLLVIFPSLDRDERISCSLLHQPLSEGIQYEALSYTWGKGNAEFPILIDGGVFNISQNLYFALRKLRHAQEERVVWIDAICINQSSDVEKGHQVSQMGRIYSVAQEVAVWLGEGNDASGLGMESLTLLLQMATSRTKNTNTTNEGFRAFASSISSLLALPDFESRLLGLAEVFSRPWWFRVWTLQEITLAKEAVIYCGERQVPWDYFEIFAQVFEVPQVLDVLASQQSQSEVGRKAATALPG